MNINFKTVFGLLFLLAVVGFSGKLTSVPIEGELMAQSAVSTQANGVLAKRVLGPVVSVSEGETEIDFLARVDTGAKTTSIHAAEKQVVGGSDYMEDNVGKTVRFRIENRNGKSQWLERKIAEVRKIRTSEGEETRYLVPMKLTVDDVDRNVLVSLNDRSRMTYALLLGRNLLAGHFLVDVTGADETPDLLASGI